MMIATFTFVVPWHQSWLQRFSSKSSGEYVLKLNNPLLASYDVLKSINGLLNHLHTKGFNKCNRPLANREGADLLRITREKLLEYDKIDCRTETLGNMEESVVEDTFFLRVLTYIPGECLDDVDKCYLTPQLLYNVGHCIGGAASILQVVCLVGWAALYLITNFITSPIYFCL